MTLEWSGASDDHTARCLVLRVATARHLEGTTRVQLRECVTYASTVRDGPIPPDELKQLIDAITAEWRLHKSTLNTARLDLQNEKDRRLQNGQSVAALQEHHIQAWSDKMLQTIDISAPTPLDTLLAKYQSPDRLEQTADASLEEDDQPSRARRR